MKQKTVQILIPVYNEEKNLYLLVDKLRLVFNGLKQFKYEVILVDDGSNSSTVTIELELIKKYKNIKLVRLSRNFGKEIALTAGIDHADGDAIIIMDGDLQHPPEFIPEFLKKWEAGFDIVASKRKSIEKQPILRRFGSWLFYKIINSISDFKMEPGTTDFRLLDKKVVNELKKFKERNRMVRGLIDWMGFDKAWVEFHAPERNSGESVYGYGRLMRLAINSMTSFSFFPLRIAGYLGLFIGFSFGLLLIFMILDKLTFDRFGFTSISYIVVVNSFFIGIVLSCLGLIALYIGNIYTEVQDRSMYIVKNKIGFSYKNSLKK